MNPIELINKARRGVTGEELIKINDDLCLSNKDWSFFLGISTNTFSAYIRKNKTFDIKKSEKILLIRNFFSKGKIIFGSMSKFKKWLEFKSKIFNNQTPLSFLNTYSGIELLEVELHR